MNIFRLVCRPPVNSQLLRVKGERQGWLQKLLMLWCHGKKVFRRKTRDLVQEKHAQFALGKYYNNSRIQPNISQPKLVRLWSAFSWSQAMDHLFRLQVEHHTCYCIPLIFLLNFQPFLFRVNIRNKVEVNQPLLQGFWRPCGHPSLLARIKSSLAVDVGS